MFFFLGNEPCLFLTTGFIVIDDPRASSIPMPDVSKPLPPQKVEREERTLSTERTPAPSKVRARYLYMQACRSLMKHVQRDKETKGKDTDVSKIREKHAQDKASTR